MLQRYNINKGKQSLSICLIFWMILDTAYGMYFVSIWFNMDISQTG